MKYIWKTISRKSNNRGSSLIAVMVCVMLVFTLGMAMLTSAAVNIQMKTIDRLSTENLYDAEAALNEICTGLQRISEEALEEAITYSETHYATTPDTERNRMLNRKYMHVLFEKLCKTAEMKKITVEENLQGNRHISGAEVPSAAANTGFFATLANFTTAYTQCSDKQNSPVEVYGDSPYIVMDEETFSAGIRSLSVKYTDEKNYETTITTDVMIAPPGEDGYYNTNVNIEAGSIEADGYSIIADGVVTVPAGSFDVSGSIYAGEGIKVNGGMKIRGKKIVSRSDLESIGEGTISVKKTTDGDTPQLWLKNIVTSEANADVTEAASASSVCAIDITGDCYISDDLIMNKSGRNVRISGDYYGYHSGIVTNTTERADGSAVSINAQNADLDIASEAEQALWLAGKNILDDFGEQADENYSKVNKAGKVYEGESLSYKWTQSAYMVPASILPKEAGGMNPMPADDYENLLKSDDTSWENPAGKKLLKLDFQNYTYAAQLNISEYLNENEPYIVKYVQHYTGSGESNVENYVYLYLNFETDSSRSSYFSALISNAAQRSVLLALADMENYGKVTVNHSVKNGTMTPSTKATDGSITSTGSSKQTNVHTGNIVTFDSSLRSVLESELNNALNQAIANPDSIDANKTGDGTIYEDPFGGGEQEGSSSTEINTLPGTGSGGTAPVIPADLSTVSEYKTPNGTMTMAENNVSAYDSLILNKEIRTTYQYNGLITILDAGKNVGYPSMKLVRDYLLRNNGYSEVQEEDHPGTIDQEKTTLNVIYSVVETKDAEGKSVSILKKELLKKGADGSVAIGGTENNYNNGLIISDCNIKISSGQVFDGTIITSGNVEIASNIKSDYLKKEVNVLDENGKMVMDGNVPVMGSFVEMIFQNAEKSVSLTRYDGSDGSAPTVRTKLRFENWRKN